MIAIGRIEMEARLRQAELLRAMEQQKQQAHAQDVAKSVRRSQPIGSQFFMQRFGSLRKPFTPQPV